MVGVADNGASMTRPLSVEPEHAILVVVVVFVVACSVLVVRELPEVRAARACWCVRVALGVFVSGLLVGAVARVASVVRAEFVLVAWVAAILVAPVACAVVLSSVVVVVVIVVVVVVVVVAIVVVVPLLLIVVAVVVLLLLLLRHARTAASGMCRFSESHATLRWFWKCS